MKIRITFVITCLLLMSLVAKAQDIVWDFATDAQGWHDLGAGRDVTASWENGSLKLTYFENSSGQGPQLWFPAIQVEQEFDASNYRYLEISYSTLNWPTTLPTKFLVTIKKSNDELVYAYSDIDPTKNFVSIDIGSLDPGWGTPYIGIMKSVEIELPHTGAAASNPATNWFGSSTMIDKVVLTNTQTIPLSTYKVHHWSFDKDFSDSTHQITGIPNGNPVIDKLSAKTGSGALLLSGSDYLTMPADFVFSSEKISYTFWIKTPAAGQADPEKASCIISYGSLNFELALFQGNLSLSDYRSWYDFITPWENNVWQRVALVVDGSKVLCYLNGIKIGETISSKAQDRLGNLVIGSNGLTAIIDELSIYNYVLTDEEIVSDGLVPPGIIAPWNFDADLEGWHEIADGNERDVDLSWGDGMMIITYANNAIYDGPQLWFPQVQVNATFDATLYPYCDIYYETINWPANSEVKALLEFTKADGSVAYSYFDLDPAESFVRVDISMTDPGWGVLYSGKIASVKLEIPYNGSTSLAEDWFGASTKITKIEFNNTQPPIEDTWNATLENSIFTKSGLEALNYQYYQYQPIGLGGTVMRVSPWGIGTNLAPHASVNPWHIHEPYLSYEYWWDTEAHRFNPFILNAGYGDSYNPGTIKEFEQNLNVNTGLLETILTLDLDGIIFTSERSAFITPEGIIVIRIKDSGAPLPLKLNVAVEKDVRIYGNGGFYNEPHEPFIREDSNTVAKIIEGLIQGGVVVATREKTSTGALAVAIDAPSSVIVSGDNDVYSTANPNGIVTYFIAPASSFNPVSHNAPDEYAWNAAYAAKIKGYDQLKNETALWWEEYMNISKVSVPDEKVLKLFTQSLFYHGVYFGNCEIPPGCNSTDIESFAGAICPDYDLVLSQMPLVYTGHLNEAKNVADWCYKVLPKCKDYAVNGITHYDKTRQYDAGAIYTTLMGYDGTMLKFPTEPEAIQLDFNIAGANASLMALSYLDFSDDDSFQNAAYDILKSTTYVSMKDLIYDSRYNAYRSKEVPATVQQAAMQYGLEQCIKRGIAEPDWLGYEGKVVVPTGTLNGDTLISGGIGAIPQVAQGDATWLQHIWYDGVVNKHDSRALPSYQNTAKSKTGNYIFNNGWMGVVAAKLYLGDEALSWLKKFESAGVYFDETCFTETIDPVLGGLEFALTPEIGAHGAYICNLTQMLIDPDDEEVIDVFPAIPYIWDYKEISFENLITTGALSFTAQRDINGAKVVITNNSNSLREREIRIKVPQFITIQNGKDLNIQEGFIVENIALPPGTTDSLEYYFSAPVDTSNIFNSITNKLVEGGVFIYPNPNSTGILNISGANNLDNVHIYSLKGALVKIFENQQDNFNISDLRSGIYIVHFMSDNKINCELLVIE